MRNSRWIDWGGNGPSVVFAHANGFPVRSYSQFLGPLAERFQIFGWEARPLVPGSDPREISGWPCLAGDLEGIIEERFTDPVIGVGHSLGGVLSLLASASNPYLFRALVLIDPVILSGIRSMIWGLLKRWGRSNWLPLIVGTLRRRDVWPDRETVRRSWIGKAAFEGWTPEAFEAYLTTSIEEDETATSVRLRYPKAWEARIFEISPHDVWSEVAKLSIPVLVLRGQHSDTLTPGAARRIERVAPNAECRVVEGTGHMLPMQRPDEVARITTQWLTERLEQD